MWTTSTDSLLRIFRDAIIALIPIAERARMHWREPEAYDDWDDMCAAIYESIVIRSFDFANEIASSPPVPRYDQRISSYNQNNYIGDANLKAAGAFICFETRIEPLDTCLFAILDENQNVIGQRRISTAETTFVFFRWNTHTGTREPIDTLNISL
jgi:hypothetical protein